MKPGDDETKKEAEAVRAWLRDLRDAALKLPLCRATASFLTKLDEASMWLEVVEKGVTPLGAQA